VFDVPCIRGNRTERRLVVQDKAQYARGGGRKAQLISV
jgi:hypothetical protein